MQFYVKFQADGNIAGFYNDKLHGENIPAGAVPITTEDWQTYINDTRLYKLDADGVTIRLKTQQELDEEAANQPPSVKTEQQLKIEQLEASAAKSEKDTLDAMDAVFDLYLQVLDLQAAVGGGTV